MPYATVNDIQLYYEEHGKGTPLVLVHGFSGAGAVWAGAIAAFAQNYRVIVPDLRAHGHSTGSPETIHHVWFARDLVALLDHLQIDRAHFIGHSSGGMCLFFIGIYYQLRVRTFILVNATYTFDEFARRYMRQVADELEYQPEAIKMSQQLHGPTHGNEHWKVHQEAFRAFTTDPNELPFQPADLARIARPVLVLHGDRDPFFPVNIPTTMYRSMPNAELCILPFTGHGIPEERPQLFMTICSEFLQRHANA